MQTHTVGARENRGGAAEAAGVPLSHHNCHHFPGLVCTYAVLCIISHQLTLKQHSLWGAGITPLVYAFDCRTPRHLQPCGRMGLYVVMMGGDFTSFVSYTFIAFRHRLRRRSAIISGPFCRQQLISLRCDIRDWDNRCHSMMPQATRPELGRLVPATGARASGEGGLPQHLGAGGKASGLPTLRLGGIAATDPSELRPLRPVSP